MRSNRIGLGALVVVAVAGGGVAGFFAREILPPTGDPRPVDEAGSRAPAALPPGHRDQIALPERIDWIAVGGGAEPATNQVSLEQDLALVREVLGAGSGVVMHAGGEGVGGVQVLGSEPVADGDPMLARLGELLDPRPDRGAQYRSSGLVGAQPAMLDAVLGALERGLRQPREDPLLFYFTGHGEGGATPGESLVRLWGGWGVGPEDLDEALAGSRRMVRIVIAACFSGGFGELAFRDTNAEAGIPATDRCGLFASTWDRESAGCDPNPERGEQNGFTLYFGNALAGRDRDGRPLALSALDHDGDGDVSLLEAHARVRIESRSIDVPTTTSEVWLRRAAPSSGREAEVELPIEVAVRDALSEALGVPDEATVLERLGRLEEEIEHRQDELAEAEELADERWAEARIALLERWPVLHDPYHPEFWDTIEANRDAIAQILSAADASGWREAEARRDEPARRISDLEVERALLLRLARTHETLRLARRLRARGGPAWDAFVALRDCERSRP